MNVIRGWLFDNLGLKLVALLLALLVYLNVYTERPANLIVSFPLQVVDLADSLSLSGAVPATVQAELRGGGKQLLRMRLTEPQVKLSLAGVGVGRYERALMAVDLPVPADVTVERLVSPRTVELQVERKAHRRLAVAARVEGVPAGGVVWTGDLLVEPTKVEVTGPQQALATLDSVRLDAVRITGKRDTVHAAVDADALPDWCVMDPEKVTVTVPLEPGASRRLAVRIEPPRGAEGFTVAPERVTLTVSARRSQLTPGALDDVHVRWVAPLSPESLLGRRVGLRWVGNFPEHARVRLDPESVTVRRAPP